MANTVSSITYANTFAEWVVATNGLVRENNDLAANNYTKSTGTLYLNDPSLALQSGNTIIAGQLQVQGTGSSAYIQNNLRVDTQVYFTNTVMGLTNSGQANIGGPLFALGSGTGLTVANNAVIAGNITTNNIQANNSVSTSNANIVNTTTTNFLQANTGANTNTLSVVGTTYTDKVQANSSINTGILSVSDTAYIDVVQANVIVHTSTISATGPAYIYSLQSNNSVNTTNISATSYVYTNQLVANTKIGIAGQDVYINATDAHLPNVVASSVQVNGPFIISGSTVYTSNTFTVAQGVLSNQNGHINVFRPNGANASIRWNDANTYWDIHDVNNNGSYSKILTANLISDSTVSNSQLTVASSNAANILNNTIISTKSTLDNNVALVFSRANTAANTFVGTAGVINASSGVVSFTSNNGVTIAATSANNLAISTAQDIRTTANPTFASLTLSAPLAISQGGTGASSSSSALTSLLPSGTTAGYVLTTGGPGNFYWAASSGGGGGGVTPGTTINSTRLSYTANGAAGFAGNTFTTPTFTSSTQVRAYINGVRQFESEYSLNQSANTITFSTGPLNGDGVLVEVDGYYVNPYYANNIAFTVNSNIGATANTIQLAVDGLTSKVTTYYANLAASPAFTTIATGVTVDANTSNTAFATAAFVKNALNSGNTFTHSITGNAGTVTNGLYSNGSYSNPAWIVGLAGSKIVGTVPSANTITDYSINQSVATASNVQFNSLGVGTSGTGTAGEIRATNNITAYYSASDRRIKENIVPLSGALNKIDNFGAYNFNYKTRPDQKMIGVIAQELMQEYPELVYETTPIDDGTGLDKIYAVNYELMTAVLLQAVKELKAEVEALKGNNK